MYVTKLILPELLAYLKTCKSVELSYRELVIAMIVISMLPRKTTCIEAPGQEHSVCVTVVTKRCTPCTTIGMVYALPPYLSLFRK